VKSADARAAATAREFKVVDVDEANEKQWNAIILFKDGPNTWMASTVYGRFQRELPRYFKTEEDLSNIDMLAVAVHPVMPLPLPLRRSSRPQCKRIEGKTSM
jgi:hypothetical protein